MHWNNEAPPLEYEVTAAAGVQVTPAAAAFAVVEEPADADPREFLVDIRADDRGEPLDVAGHLLRVLMTRTRSASR